LTIKAPKGLSHQSRQTWKRVTDIYILSPDGLLVLEGALREWDAYLAAEVGSTARSTNYKNFLASIRHLGISAASEGATA
jgi:hypothetical protein